MKTTSTSDTSKMDFNLTEMVLIEILERNNLTEISDTKRAEYLAKLEPIVEHRIVGIILSAMSPEQKEMYQVVNSENEFTLDQLELLMSDPEIEAKITEELVAIIEEFTDILS